MAKCINMTLQQETLLKAMQKQCTAEQLSSLDFQHKEAVLCDIKDIKSEMKSMRDDVSEIKNIIQKQNSFWSNVKSMLSNKVVIMIILFWIAKNLELEKIQAMATFFNPL